MMMSHSIIEHHGGIFPWGVELPLKGFEVTRDCCEIQPLSTFVNLCRCLKIAWMEEPGRLQSMGPLRVRHD